MLSSRAADRCDFSSFGGPSINDSGAVAFNAVLDDVFRTLIVRADPIG
ncbi:MAG TPA: hypothetical protein VGD69_02270 [Herpetosiphonaceae bacterium]